jgi:hypothetical protein
MTLQPQETGCKSCGHTMKRYTAAQSPHIYCSRCGQYHKANRLGELSIKTGTFATGKNPEYLFPIGHVITIGDVTYTLIARALKEDAQYKEFTWKEYTLYSEEAGYIWLSESMGHWMVLTELDAVPVRGSSDSIAILDTQQYDIFQKSRFNTIHASGEFASIPLLKGVRYQEYISPPEMLSVEMSASAHTWFKGVHISGKDLAKGANVEANTLPPRYGVGAVQPFASNVSQHINTGIAAAGCMLMLIIMMISSSSFSGTDTVTAYSYEADTLTKKITTGSFEIKKTGALQLLYESDCYNNWSEAEVELVNEATGESRGTIIGAEYYAGTDSEGSWTEGSKTSDQIISSVEAGKYHLLITPFRGTSNTSGAMFTLKLTQGVSIGSNLLCCALLLVLVPVIQYFRRRSFESSRWSSSDYNPYSYNE